MPPTTDLTYRDRLSPDRLVGRLIPDDEWQRARRALATAPEFWRLCAEQATDPAERARYLGHAETTARYRRDHLAGVAP